MQLELDHRRNEEGETVLKVSSRRMMFVESKPSNFLSVLKNNVVDVSAMSLENWNSIISNNNNNAGSNNISKENESNSWMARNESEIIDLD